MTLVHNTYGKGRVRVMRLHTTAERHEVRELSVQVMIEGDFGRAYTDADNSTSVATDTMKNLVNIVARENPALETEPFCAAVAKRLLDRYPQIAKAIVTGSETQWVRLSVDGAPHPHGFVLAGNGKPFATVTTARAEMKTTSGIDGFTFMKTTASGWENYVIDDCTTLKPTDDRICATSMRAEWAWRSAPADYPASRQRILDTMLEVFLTTYSASVQDSLYRMGEAALAAVPEIEMITLACPNKHYIPMNLSAFGLENDNVVFLPTDEPHGQIECTVGRG